MGRKKITKPEDKAPNRPAVGYRLSEEEYAALVKYAKENDRTPAAESARAVRKYLRELGLIEND